MQVPASVKPAIWGAIGGAVAAMIIGFVWGAGYREEQPKEWWRPAPRMLQS